MSELNDLLTIRDYIRLAVSRFTEAGLYYGHGTDNALDEACALIFHTLHLPHDVNPTLLDARLTQPERSQLIALITKRAQERIPVPYLTHEAWFAGLPFYVDERVLIPRSPIAELIENQFEPWINPDSVNKILDLCTGSGCIAIALAKYFPETSITASDVSLNALNVAKTNVTRHKVEDQVELIQSDVFAAIPRNQCFDIIVSNPPYVDAVDMANLPKEYHHEPSLGLASGHDGLDITKNILKHAAQHLTANGILVVEVGNSEHALAEQYPNIPFTWLEFERGGGGVFLLTADQIKEYTHVW